MRRINQIIFVVSLFFAASTALAQDEQKEDEKLVSTDIICNIGPPERIRTSDLCLRRAALYPAELRADLSQYLRASIQS